MRVVKEAPMLTLCRIMHRKEYRDLTDKIYGSPVAVLYCIVRIIASNTLPNLRESMNRIHRAGWERSCSLAGTTGH